MKVTTVLKPTMLFAAGSVASAAGAAIPLQEVNYQATRDGVPITLVGTDAQYIFQIQTRDLDGPKDAYYLVGQNGAQVSFNYGTAEEAEDARVYFDDAKTGQVQSASDFAARGVSSDEFYGLRFSVNNVAYQGIAGTADGGSTINQIGFEAINAVPEPESWALMIAGFGGLGLAMRRRRRQAPAVAVAVA